MAASFFYAPWQGLSRRPLLTAMMVFSMGFVAAGFVIWRCTAGEAARPMCQPLFLVSTRESLSREETPQRTDPRWRRQPSLIGMQG